MPQEINPEKIKTVLVIRNDRFGEFLLNIPALRALKETFTDAKIIAVVDSYVKGLAECILYIDEIMVWERKEHSPAEVVKLISLLRKKNIDIAVMLNPSRDFNIITYLCGIPVRVGYNRKWGFLLTHKIEDKKHLGQKHEVEYNLELVGLTGARTEDKSLSLNDAANYDLGRFGISTKDFLIALHPWTSDPVKQWPLSRFRCLAEYLSNIPGIKVLLVGGKENLSASKENFSGLNSNVIDLTGITTLVQLAHVLKKCKLLISCDSGPVHLACCLGTQVLAIFRNDLAGKTAERWGPWGEGHIVIDKSAFRDITAEEVFSAAKDLLELYNLSL